jgi:hypothetical protein
MALCEHLSQITDSFNSEVLIEGTTQPRYQPFSCKRKCQKRRRMRMPVPWELPVSPTEYLMSEKRFERMRSSLDLGELAWEHLPKQDSQSFHMILDHVRGAIF